MKVDKSKWEKLTFSQIGKSQLGKTLDSKRNMGKPYPYLCAVNVGYGNFNLSNIKEILLEEDELDKYLVKKGDLLICEGGDTGRCAIWESDKPIYYQNALHRVRFKDGINNRFIMYAMHYLKLNGTIDRYSHGQTIKHLTHKGLNKLVFNVPNITVQQTIASELDAVQEMIDGYKAQLEDLDALTQSIFLDTFGDPISNPKGWKKKSLGTLCEVSSAKRVLVKDIVSEGVPFIRGTELAILSKQCFFDKSIFSMFITPEHYDKVKAITGVPEIDDLLIPSINPYGYVWRINTTEPIYFKDGRVIWIHTNHSIYNGDCLRHILVYEILEKYSKLSGAVFAELTLVFLRTLKIIVPPLPLQQQFAKQVEAIEKQKNLLREQLKDAETLMAERMQYYFS